tara:strand:- start:627 stop:1166 length:540 start_codon:yes stop_codon:yes gene_type:complete
MKITLISALLLVFFVSCEQMRNLSDGPETYETEKQRAQTKKTEDMDLRLPSESTILDAGKGFTLLDALGLDSPVDYQTKSITFNVALDKVAFMPLISVDSSAGVIVTDWYSLDDGQSRIKINIRIIDQEMNEESLIVSLFSQSLDNDRWVDEGINSEQSSKIKDSILNSARSLKIASEL